MTKMPFNFRDTQRNCPKGTAYIVGGGCCVGYRLFDGRVVRPDGVSCVVVEDLESFVVDGGEGHAKSVRQMRGGSE